MKVVQQPNGTIRIVLEAEDFGRLVRGKVTTDAGVSIILEDMGFHPMVRAITDAATDECNTEPKGDAQGR